VASFAADEAWDALLGAKTVEAGTAATAVGGGALCFFLCSIHVIVVASSIQMKNSSHFSFSFAIKCCDKNFFVVISPNLILFSHFFLKSPYIH
jgi:hypothetical protein